MKLKDALNRTAERMTKQTILRLRRKYPDARITEIREKAAGLLGITRQTTFKYYPAEK